MDISYADRYYAAVAEYESGNLKSALSGAGQLLLDTNAPFKIRMNAAAIVIDCSTVATSLEALDEATTLLSNHLDDAGDLRNKVAYNLANGHMAALKLEVRLKGQSGYVFRNHHVEASKTLLRSVIDSDSTDLEAKSMAYINYADTLNRVGRSLEVLATDERAVALNPNNAVAESGIASALCALASTLGEHQHELLKEAREHYRRALEHKSELVYYGGPSMPEWVRNRADKLEQRLVGREATANIEGNEPTASSNLSAYTRFCIRHDLMLNYCRSCTKCSACARDTIFFRSLTLPFDDDPKFERLATFFNQIKEDYATARYLAYVADTETDELDDISVMTRYADTLNYASFDLYGGLLKASFRGAADTLDKVAGFMRVYLDMSELGQNRVHFSNLWWDKNEQLRAPIAALLPSNPGIAALADMALDWCSGDKKRTEARLHALRNSLVHRYAVLHSEITPDGASEPGEHVSLHRFRDSTLDMLRLVRAAIVYMTTAIVVHERSKQPSKDGLVLPMFFDFSQNPDWRVRYRQLEDEPGDK